jgi:hypothetical protein
MPTIEQMKANAAIVKRIPWFNLPRAIAMTLTTVADALMEIAQELKRHNDREGDTNGK